MMGQDELVTLVLETWQENRLDKLHKCPDCNYWLKILGGWNKEDHPLGPRMRNKVQCLECKKTITIILVGPWIDLWEKKYGWKEY